MAQNKRASMREGPLAALFRKTEEEDAASEGGQAARSEAQTPAASARAAKSEGEAEAQAPAARASERELELDSQDAQERVDTERAPAAEKATAPSAAPSAKTAAGRARKAPEPVSETESAEPAQSEGAGSAPGDGEDDSARVPSPRERLRNVFSSEIPANVMEPPATAAPAPDSSTGEARAHGEPSAAAEAPPAFDVYAREEPRAFGTAAPVAHPAIRVVGVGGAGVNAVNRMVEAEVEGVEFLAINTDLQSLQQSTADITLHIGAELTRGLGSGSDTSLGRQAAMDDYDRAKALLKGSDMIFITAGAGGGTGTGAAPIIARIAREVGALAVAIVTKPFGFEGSRRAEQAELGVRALAERSTR
jgi:cell division protein FtsZ